MDFLRGIKESKVKAFKGRPRAVYLTDRYGTTQGIRTEGYFKTPASNRVADVAAVAGTAWLVVHNMIAVLDMPDPAFEQPLAALLAYLPLKFGFRHMARPHLSIDVMADEIRITHLFRTRRFARADVQGFAVIDQHEQAHAEKRRLEFEARRDQMKRRARRRTTYYQDAAHLVLVVGGERVDVASTARGKDAHAFAGRGNRALHQMDRQIERRELALREKAVAAVPGQLPE